MYVNTAADYISHNFPNSPLVSNIRDPNANLDLTGADYGTLLTKNSDIYIQFMEWYNVFFGTNGLISYEEEVVMDGVVPIYQFKTNITFLDNGNGINVF